MFICIYFKSIKTVSKSKFFINFFSSEDDSSFKCWILWCHDEKNVWISYILVAAKYIDYVIHRLDDKRTSKSCIRRLQRDFTKFTISVSLYSRSPATVKIIKKYSFAIRTHIQWIDSYHSCYSCWKYKFCKNTRTKNRFELNTDKSACKNFSFFSTSTPKVVVAPLPP